jgi:hypothetical protein
MCDPQMQAPLKAPTSLTNTTSITFSAYLYCRRKLGLVCKISLELSSQFDWFLPTRTTKAASVVLTVQSLP